MSQPNQTGLKSNGKEKIFASKKSKRNKKTKKRDNKELLPKRSMQNLSLTSSDQLKSAFKLIL